MHFSIGDIYPVGIKLNACVYFVLRRDEMG